MKSRKNTIKRGGAYFPEINANRNGSSLKFFARPSLKYFDGRPVQGSLVDSGLKLEQKGGSKRKSRKSRKAKNTKKGRVAYEGGKKKCPKHCRRHTSRTRKGLKHRKN